MERFLMGVPYFILFVGGLSRELLEIFDDFIETTRCGAPPPDGFGDFPIS
jgi:hypothetical protein